jgi:glutathione peroxidase
MKKLLLVVFLFQGILLSNAQIQTLYDFKLKDIDERYFNMESLKGKKVLIVNTASKCGFTPQYEGLEKLYKKYGGDKFVILAFPSNDFARQEPGTNAEIKEFCSKNYEVSFPMMEKVSVKGSDATPLFKWLCSKELNGFADYKIGWNFSKFMIDENGRVVGHVSSTSQPDCPEIITWLTN